MPNTTVISVVSTKGGVGKTTLTANISGLLAALGYRVLAIDADMQPSLSKFYKTETAPTSGISEVISRGGLIQPTDIVRTSIGGLDMIVSNLSDHVQSWLKEREDRLVLLKRAIRQPVIRDTYDYVVIDTQGAKGELQRTAAMAADLMVSPLRPDLINYAEFHTGTLEMMRSLNSMADLSAELRSGPLSIVINGLNRTNNSRMFEETIRNDFRDHPNVRLLDVCVPESVKYQEGRTVQMPVHLLDRPIKGRARGTSAYEVVHRLVFELLPNLSGLWVDEVPEAVADVVTGIVTESAEA